jgi:hypothetical protein
MSPFLDSLPDSLPSHLRHPYSVGTSPLAGPVVDNISGGVVKTRAWGWGLCLGVGIGAREDWGASSCHFSDKKHFVTEGPCCKGWIGVMMFSSGSCDAPGF